ncbi:MAG: dTDP-4-dehydrorhamnose reductase [Deltaproteobacteria bacterium]|nr:dTDP-4-dehydrorhamnose reductase [Deltaproteobacteria bacterium]
MNSRVLITGRHGQLARELARTAPDCVEFQCVSSSELDISNEQDVFQYVTAYGPQVIVNAAAYTQVDKAETEPDRAFAVNAQGVLHLARACDSIKARLIHISTDFVFDGANASPYSAQDIPNPLSVYGKSKLEGERLAQEAMPHNNLFILRTSWLYSTHGRNFVKTMLGLAATRNEIRVVCDQVGSPTWAKDLALAVWNAVGRDGISGIHHFSNAGVASWYDLASAVFKEAVALGLLLREPVVHPIPTEAYPTPARRPFYSVLNCFRTWDCLGITPVHWCESLHRMLIELKGNMP